MVAFIIIVRFIVYFCISFIVQNNVIVKGKITKYFTKYVAVFSSEYLINREGERERETERDKIIKKKTF